MWKSGIFLRITRVFYPQANVEEFCLFHSLCEDNFPGNLSTEMFSTLHRHCGKHLREYILLLFRQEKNEKKPT